MIHLKLALTNSLFCGNYVATHLKTLLPQMGTLYSRFIIIPGGGTQLLAQCQNDVTCNGWWQSFISIISSLQKCGMMSAAGEAMKDKCPETENN